MNTTIEVEKPAEHARCHNATGLTKDASESANQTEIDRQLASKMQELYNNEGSGGLQKTHDEISENRKEDTGPEVVDSSSVVTTLAEMVEENGRLFIGVRRGSPLNRVLSMWDREKKKNVA